MHAHSCLRRHSIAHHEWRIWDFSEGVLHVRPDTKSVGGGGGAVCFRSDTKSGGPLFSKYVIVNN